MAVIGNENSYAILIGVGKREEDNESLNQNRTHDGGTI